jgi:hypothetical protein
LIEIVPGFKDVGHGRAEHQAATTLNLSLTVPLERLLPMTIAEEAPPRVLSP